MSESRPSLEPVQSLLNDDIRKRVPKACDQCRLRKTKCDGVHPCSRCQIYNAICVFGDRKKAQEKIYPKGYVELLEQQQGYLILGLREFYRRTLNGEEWPGGRLKTMANGLPLTHDLLARLGILNGIEGDRLKEISREYQQEFFFSDNGDEGHPGSMSSTNQSPIDESQLWPNAFNDRNRPPLYASQTPPSTSSLWENDVNNDQKLEDAPIWGGNGSHTLSNEMDPTDLVGYADALLEDQQNMLFIPNLRCW